MLSVPLLLSRPAGNLGEASFWGLALAGVARYTKDLPEIRAEFTDRMWGSLPRSPFPGSLLFPEAVFVHSCPLALWAVKRGILAEFWPPPSRGRHPAVENRTLTHCCPFLPSDDTPLAPAWVRWLLGSLSSYFSCFHSVQSLQLLSVWLAPGLASVFNSHISPSGQPCNKRIIIVVACLLSPG